MGIFDPAVSFFAEKWFSDIKWSDANGDGLPQKGEMETPVSDAYLGQFYRYKLWQLVKDRPKKASFNLYNKDYGYLVDNNGPVRQIVEESLVGRYYDREVVVINYIAGSYTHRSFILGLKGSDAVAAQAVSKEPDCALKKALAILERGDVADRHVAAGKVSFFGDRAHETAVDPLVVSRFEISSVTKDHDKIFVFMNRDNNCGYVTYTVLAVKDGRVTASADISSSHPAEAIDTLLGKLEVPPK